MTDSDRIIITETTGLGFRARCACGWAGPDRGYGKLAEAHATIDWEDHQPACRKPDARFVDRAEVADRPSLASIATRIEDSPPARRLIAEAMTSFPEVLVLGVGLDITAERSLWRDTFIELGYTVGLPDTEPNPGARDWFYISTSRYQTRIDVMPADRPPGVGIMGVQPGMIVVHAPSVAVPNRAVVELPELVSINPRGIAGGIFHLDPAVTPA